MLCHMWFGSLLGSLFGSFGRLRHNLIRKLGNQIRTCLGMRLHILFGMRPDSLFGMQVDKYLGTTLGIQFGMRYRKQFDNLDRTLRM